MGEELHISVVSPADVKLERKIVKDVSYKLNSLLDNKVKIVTHLWEDYPADFHRDRQTCFDDYHALEKSDIIVAILWSRIGTLLEATFSGIITDSKRVTGTQFEIEHAISTGKPLWIYIKTDKGNITLEDAMEVGKQKLRLDSFLKELEVGNGSTKHGYHDFLENEFEEIFTSHLKAEIKKRYRIDISSISQKIESSNLSMIDSSYYFGLYGGLAILIVILFQFVHTSSVPIPNNVNMVSLFSSVSIGILALAVYMTPIRSSVLEHTFRQIVYALLRRGAFILFSALVLSISFWLTLKSIF